MDHNYCIDLLRLGGIINTMKNLSCMEGNTITKSMAMELEIYAEWLDCYICNHLKKDVDGDDETEEAVTRSDS
jgi:hypothetical protein